MKFNWDGFTEIDFVDYCAKMENDMLYEFDYVGCVRVGDLCFDLLCRTKIDNDDELILTSDLYVGGIDTGYANGKNNYPYSDAEIGCDFEDSCISMTYDDFVKYAEKEFEKCILKNDSLYNECSLIEKANEKLNVW